MEQRLDHALMALQRLTGTETGAVLRWLQRLNGTKAGAVLGRLQRVTGKQAGVEALLGSSWTDERLLKTRIQHTLIFHCQSQAIYSHDFHWKSLKVTYHAVTHDHFRWIIWSC